MANFNFAQSFGYDWPPDSLLLWPEDGSVLSHTLSKSATQFIYTSSFGYKIILQGTGFTYDVKGVGNGGTVTQMTIQALDGTTFATATGLNAGLQRLSSFTFGFDRGTRGYEYPNSWNAVQHLMRGNDSVTGSAGDDDLTGGRGSDTIMAGAGSDFITGDAGNDRLDGGIDYDTLSYRDAIWDNTVDHGINLDAVANTVVDPWSGHDIISGFERYFDTNFADILRGSALDEEFSLTSGNDVLDGRGGFDTVDYSQSWRWGASQGITANLATGIILDGWGNTDRVVNVEAIFGTNLNDNLTGNALDNFFASGDGVDTVNGGAGRDKVGFWMVNDSETGHGVIVNLSLATKNVLDDGFGNVETVTGIEDLDGSRFADKLIGTTGANNLSGSDGNDTLSGGQGNDTLVGDWGNDSILGGLGDDVIIGGVGRDVLTGHAGADGFIYFGFDGEEGDTVTDFEVGIDSFQLGAAGLFNLLAGDLQSAQFRSGAGVTTASNTSQRIIYNTTTGDVYFDEDGLGGVDAVLYATLSNKAALSSSDFNIFFA